MSADLQERYEAVRGEMVQQYRLKAGLENHWLIYALIGWQHLAACAILYYLQQHLEVEQRWIFFSVKVAQILLAVVTIRMIVPSHQLGRTPIESISKQLWLIFLLLCIFIDLLNVLAQLPPFTSLPANAALAALAFSVMTRLFSKKFLLAGNFLCVAGVLMALYYEYSLLIYGVAWCLVLQGIGVWFWFDRRRGQATPRCSISAAGGTSATRTPETAATD